MKVFDFPIDRIVGSIFDSTKHELVTAQNILSGNQNVISLSNNSDYFVTEYLYYLLTNYLSGQELVHRDDKDIRYDAILQYKAKQSFKTKLRALADEQVDITEIEYNLKSIEVRKFSDFYDESMYLDFVTKTSINITYRGINCIVNPSLDGLLNIVRMQATNISSLNVKSNIPSTLFQVIRNASKPQNKTISSQLADSIVMGDFQALEELPMLGLTSNFTDIIDPNPIVVPEPSRPDSDYVLVDETNIVKFIQTTNIMRGVYL